MAGRPKKKHGAKAPWSVGWIDPDRVRHSKRIGSKALAERFARKIEGQLAARPQYAHPFAQRSSHVGEKEQAIGTYDVMEMAELDKQTF